MIVVLVDTDTLWRRRVADFMGTLGHDVVELTSAIECRRAAAAETIGAILMEERLPDGIGGELLVDIKRISADIRAVVCTLYPSVAGAVQAMRTGAAWYFAKPAPLPVLAATLLSDRTPSVLPPIDPNPISLPRLEWEHINQVLFSFAGNVSKTARALGIDRRTL